MSPVKLGEVQVFTLYTLTSRAQCDIHAVITVSPGVGNQAAVARVIRASRSTQCEIVPPRLLEWVSFVAISRELARFPKGTSETALESGCRSCVWCVCM